MRADLPAFIETLRQNREARAESLYASDKVYALLDAYDAALQSAQTQGEGWRPTHRHVKRGTTYQVVGEGRMQCEWAVKDMAYVTVYQGERGDLWVRPVVEFDDGRFERLPTPDTGKGDGR